MAWTSSHAFQLAATAVVSGAAVAALLLGFQALEREERLSQLKRSIPPSTSDDSDSVTVPRPALTSFGGSLVPPDKDDLRNAALARRAQAGDFDDELILEQLARNRVFLTSEGLAKLRGSFVVVVGLGGVGSHCAAALARSGVSRLRLIDFDQVTLSSLNRHAVATLADVGMPKVQCLHRRLIAIAPWIHWELCPEKFDEKVAPRMLGPWGGDGQGQKPDFVVDAIDNIDTKVALLKYCHDHGVPVISSMGAGTKSDPTRIVVGDISTSTDDGLSRATRRRLKLQGVLSGIPVVYSTEKAGEGKAELLPLPEEEFQKGSVGDLGVLPNFRVRILPVLGTMPAVFGLTLANHVILAITGYPMEYLPAKQRDKLYDGALAHVQSSEEKLVRHFGGGSAEIAIGLRVPITASDVAFLVEDIWHGRSVVTNLSTRLVLVRWRRPKLSPLITIGDGKDIQKSSSLRICDLVCMTRTEAALHEKKIFQEGCKLEDLYDEATIKRVDERLKEVIGYEGLRSA